MHLRKELNISIVLIVFLQVVVLVKLIAAWKVRFQFMSNIYRNINDTSYFSNLQNKYIFHFFYYHYHFIFKYTKLFFHIGVSPWRVNIFQSTQSLTNTPQQLSQGTVSGSNTSANGNNNINNNHSNNNSIINSLMCGELIYFRDPEFQVLLTYFRSPVELRDHKYPSIEDDSTIGMINMS